MRIDVACVHILHPSYYTFDPCTAAERAGDRFSVSDDCNRQAAGGLERYDMRVRSCVKGLVRRTFEYLTEGVGAPSLEVSELPP